MPPLCLRLPLILRVPLVPLFPVADFGTPHFELFTTEDGKNVGALGPGVRKRGSVGTLACGDVIAIASGCWACREAEKAGT